jgi:hypothetical protein
MARPKSQTIPETTTVDDVDGDDEEEDKFDAMVAKLAGGKTGIDPSMMMFMQMMNDSKKDAERYRREEKESRRQNLALIVSLLAPVLPILVEKIFGVKNNPMLETLLKGVMEKGNNTDMLKDAMNFMITGNQTMLQSSIQNLQSVQSVKDEIYKEEIERIKNMKDEEGAEKEGNPIIEGMKEVRLLLEATKKKGADNLNATGPALNDPTPGKQPPQKITAKTPPITMFLRSLYMLNTKGDSMTVQARAKIRTGIVMVIQDDEKLMKAIMDGDKDTLTELGTPVVMADPELLAWIGKPGVEPWISAYISKQIGPALDEIINGEQYAKEEEDSAQPPGIATDTPPTDPPETNDDQ